MNRMANMTDTADITDMTDMTDSAHADRAAHTAHTSQPEPGMQGTVASRAVTPLYFLGPEGSFTHQAALEAVRALGEQGLKPEPCGTAVQIMEHVEHGEGWGVLALENNVEGYVMPNLDMLIDAAGTAGMLRLGIDITFDAFVRPEEGTLRDNRMAQHAASPAGTVLHEVSAHPHGLAQCSNFAQRRGLSSVPAASNAAACRDIKPGQVALGPSICGDLYGLETLETGVQDYDGARTDFVVVAPRRQVVSRLRDMRAQGMERFETVVTVVPLHTGPGVLANLLDTIRDAGLNMTSFISRPIKGHEGTYSFIVTLDAAPWQPQFRSVLERIVSAGDWAKTLAVYPRGERPNPPVSAWMLPQGGARGSAESCEHTGTAHAHGDDVAGLADAGMSEWQEELLW